MATFLDLPMELHEMIASFLDLANVGLLRRVHPHINSHLIESFCRQAVFRVRAHETIDMNPDSLARSYLADNLRHLKLANTHIARFFDYCVPDEGEHAWRDHLRWRNLSLERQQEALHAMTPTHVDMAGIAQFLSCLTSVEEISVFDDQVMGELFVEDPRALITHPKLHYSRWYADTMEDFHCQCGQCNGRRSKHNRRDICYPAVLALAATQIFDSSMIYESILKLDLSCPESLYRPSPKIWVNLAEFVLRCPYLQILIVNLGSTYHDKEEAPISTFIKTMAQVIVRRPMDFIRTIILKDNPCRSSGHLPANALTRLLLEVDQSLEYLSLSFGQLLGALAQHTQLVQLLESFPNDVEYHLYMEHARGINDIKLDRAGKQFYYRLDYPLGPTFVGSEDYYSEDDIGIPSETSSGSDNHSSPEDSDMIEGESDVEDEEVDDDGDEDLSEFRSNDDENGTHGGADQNMETT